MDEFEEEKMKLGDKISQHSFVSHQAGQGGGGGEEDGG